MEVIRILGDFIDGLPDQLLGFWADLTILLPILRGLTMESGLCTPASVVVPIPRLPKVP